MLKHLGRIFFLGEFMTRREVAKRYRIDEARLRGYERAGVLPAFGTVDDKTYSDLVVLFVAARKRLSLQAIRRALRVRAFLWAKEGKGHGNDSRTEFSGDGRAGGGGENSDLPA